MNSEEFRRDFIIHRNIRIILISQGVNLVLTIYFNELFSNVIGLRLLHYHDQIITETYELDSAGMDEGLLPRQANTFDLV